MTGTKGTETGGQRKSAGDSAENHHQTQKKSEKVFGDVWYRQVSRLSDTELDQRPMEEKKDVVKREMNRSDVCENCFVVILYEILVLGIENT